MTETGIPKKKSERAGTFQCQALIVTQAPAMPALLTSAAEGGRHSEPPGPPSWSPRPAPAGSAAGCPAALLSTQGSRRRGSEKPYKPSENDAPRKALRQRAVLASVLSRFSPKSASTCCTLRAPGSCSPGCGAGGPAGAGTASRASPKGATRLGRLRALRDQTPRSLFHRIENWPRKFAEGYLS